MRRASHSREAELVPLTTSRNMTGRHTGREQNGSVMTIPAITQLLPYPVLRGPFADPSWNHEAAHLLPAAPEQRVIDRHRHRVPRAGQQGHSQAGESEAEIIRAPPGTGEEIVRAVMRPCPRQSRPGQHPAHRPPPRLSPEPAGQRAERAE